MERHLAGRPRSRQALYCLTFARSRRNILHMARERRPPRTRTVSPQTLLRLEALGERVRRRREALGLTQRELAGRAELSLRFLAQLEAGQGNISLLRFA